MTSRDVWGLECFASLNIVSETRISRYVPLGRSLGMYLLHQWL